MHVCMYVCMYVCISICMCGLEVLFGGSKYTHRLSYGIMAPKRGFDGDSCGLRNKECIATGIPIP